MTSLSSTIRLFKSVPVQAKDTKVLNKPLLEKTIAMGFIFSPIVAANYSRTELYRLTDLVSNEYGITSEQANSSFHKSWNKVKTASMEQLVLEQCIHYITTYGFEQLGIYDKSSVYIPQEALEIPGLKDGLPLIVINGYTKAELKTKLLELLNTGIALKDRTKDDVLDVAVFVGIDDKDIEVVKNKEVKIALYDYLGIVPSDPVEFLRYIVYTATERTLLIKDKPTIEAIKARKNLTVLGMIEKYKTDYGLEPLAQIFYRFKPIFLAFKTNSKLCTYVNKIRKLAPKYHQPMPDDYLNNITAMISRGESISEEVLRQKLLQVNNFRKIRLAYALKFRTKDVDSILYRIRNGQSYATEFKFDKQHTAKRVLDIVLDSLSRSIDVEGKKLYIPDYIQYTLPATEKQFTGDLPSGTCVVVPRDMIFGIHWKNVDGTRIDLDLSLLTESGKVGWDSRYRTDNGKILFSGDMTNASGNGSSELFYVEKQGLNASIMMVNFYNYYSGYSGIDVPIKILVAQEQTKNLEKNYTVDPNNIVSMAKTTIDCKQKILGLLVTTTTNCKFYFAETNIGNSISSHSNPYATHSRKYLFDFYRNTIGLKGVLESAGAVFVKDKEECDIDLSPEVVERDTLIKLIS